MPKKTAKYPCLFPKDFYSLKNFYFIVYLLLLFTNTKAFAAITLNPSSANPYFISDVFISASGETPSQARLNAIAQAQRKAFSLLLSRLSLDLKLAVEMDDRDINYMVHSQQITNEKIAGNEYSAIFNITFSENFVNKVLLSKNINKEAGGQEIYLVLPIELTGQQSLLWETGNEWKIAWNKSLQNKSSASDKKKFILLPQGDSQDMALVNLQTINDSNFLAFEKLLNKYQANIIALVYFDFDEIENKAGITLKTIKKDQERVLIEKQTKLSFVNVNRLEKPELLTIVANKVGDYILNNDASNSTKMAEAAPVIVSTDLEIMISNLGDWLSIKKRLESMNFIEEMKVNMISQEVVQINIKYNKQDRELAELFAPYGLLLKQENNKQVLLSKFPGGI